jgi:heptosyltransferase II
MGSASSQGQSEVRAPRRILVRGVNWLGDAVMTTPALQRLRERFPEAQLTLLTHEKLAPLWQHHPSVDAVVPFAAAQSVWSVSRVIRCQRFERAVVLPNSPRSALEAWLAGIPERIGYTRPWRNWLLTQAVPARAGRLAMRKRSNRDVRGLIHRPAPPVSCPSPEAHQIYEYLHLVAALGASSEPVAPRLEVTRAEVQEAQARLLAELSRQGNISEQKPRVWFGLNPGAEYGPAKRWPVERFIEAARQIQQRTDCTWVIFGGPSDVPIATAIHASLASSQATVNLAGQTALRQLMALLKLCRVVLTNDTGPMHVAAALGTPVVVPFGSTSPELTGPGLPGDRRHRLLRSNVPCAPCFRRTCPIDFRCMGGIAVEQVIRAVVEAWSAEDG